MEMLASIYADAVVLLTLQVTLVLAQSNRWFRIADDCTSQQADFIRAGVNNACALASNALTATGVNEFGNIYTSLPAPSLESQDLIVWLFGDFSADVRHRIADIFEVHEGILSMRNREAPAGMNLRINDIKFYCTTKRYVPKIGGGHGGVMYDTDKQAGARVSDKVACALSLMWTLNAQNKEENKGYFQIQVCPWFLDYAMSAPFQWTSSIRRQIWAKLTPIRWFIRPILAKLVYTAVDSVALFEKVLLHEMTHAHLKREFRTTDVGDLSGYG